MNSNLMISDFPHNIWIRLARFIYFCCVLTLLSLCPVGYLSFENLKLRQPTGQRISKVRKQQKEFQFCQSYSYVNRKVWCHQIWISNNLGFMVLILIYIPTYFFLVYASAKIRLGYSRVTLDWNSFGRGSNLIFMYLYFHEIFNL